VGLKERRVKLAVWRILAMGGALILAAGSVRAATPEVLSQPPMKSNSVIRPGQQGQPLADYWSDYGSESGTSQHVAAHPDSDNQPSFTEDASVFSDDAHPMEPNAYPWSSGTWWRDGCWYGDFDFVIWNRSQPFSRILGIDASRVGVEFKDNLNKHGNQLPLEPGARGTLGYILDRDVDNRDHSIEVTYLGFNNWEGTDSLVAESPQGLRVPESPNYGGFNFSDTYATNYRSDLQSLEFDYRIRNRPGRDRMIMGPDGCWTRQLSPGCTQSLIVGLRALTEQERFHWISLRDNVSPDAFSGDYLVNTKNWLFGTQIGGDIMNVHDNWYWGIKGDAGVYCNFSDGFGRIAVVDPQTPEPLVQNKASAQTAAFLGELTFMLGYNINDHMMVHANWDLALLGGLAVAPDQVSFDTYLADKQPFLNTGSQIFYTGLSLGFEAYW
jgi:hypothetical protein